MGFGSTLVVGGVILILFGIFWHLPRVTRTTGVIVESAPPVYGQTLRTITYDYTVSGAHYHGQRFLRYGRQYVGMYDVGSSFPVYFVTAHPEQSYAPFPPRVYPMIGTGIVWVLFGAVLIILGGPR